MSVSNLGARMAIGVLERDELTVPTNDMGPLEHIWPHPPGMQHPEGMRALCGVPSYEVDHRVQPSRPLGSEARLCGICRDRARAMGARA